MDTRQNRSWPMAGGREGQLRENTQVRDHFASVLGQAGGRGAAAREAPTEALVPEKALLTGLRFFPAAFSFCVCLAFLYPITATVYLAWDESVQYWIGRYGYAALLLPIIFVVTHAIHATSGVPSKPAVLCCLVVPSLMLILLSNMVLSAAIDKSSALSSSNCNSFDLKQNLQDEWEIAYQTYRTCLAATAAKFPQYLTLASSFQDYKFWDCEEYAEAYKAHKVTWGYLQSLEDDHGCGGWCSVGVTLWTSKEPRDSCSMAVSHVFQAKVKTIAFQVIIYIVLVLVLGCAALIRLGPILRARGIKW